MDVKDIDILSDKLAVLKTEKEQHAAAIKLIDSKLTVMEQTLVEALVSEGKDEWATASGKFSIKESAYWNIKDNAILLAYLQKNAPEMIKFNPVTMRGYLNEYRDQKIQEGGEPDYLATMGVTPYIKRGINFRKSKGE